MKTITTHEAKTHLSKYLAEVETGKRFIISRGKQEVAMLVPIRPEDRPPRPKVGEILGEPFEFAEAAFAPMTADELEAWGL